MLIPLQEKDFDKYVDFAYELALDPARTSAGCSWYRAG